MKNLSIALDGTERFIPDDPVRISKDATCKSIFPNAPDDPHPYAGRGGYYTGYRNPSNAKEVVVRVGKENVFVDEKFLKARKVKPKKEKVIPESAGPKIEIIQ